MKHPPYQLKANKAVDRLLFAELLRWYNVPQALKNYTYYSLGGPYLEDFKVFHEFFPELKMICIEEDSETFKRQKFHLPCRHIRLVNSKVEKFLSDYDPKDKPSIFWLDNTGLRQSHFKDFASLLNKIVVSSIIKITLQCDWLTHLDEPGETKKLDKFKARYGIYLPAGFVSIPQSSTDLAKLLQDMLQIASERVFVSSGRKFQPLNSFYYQDGLGMFTLTGIVCSSDETAKVKSKFQKLNFCNLEWEPPTEIDVPTLSTKERFLLQKHLPGAKLAGRKLQKVIGYEIADGAQKSIQQLQQYADYCRYYPHFIRAIP